MGTKELTRTVFTVTQEQKCAIQITQQVVNLHTHGPKYRHSNDHSNCAIQMIIQICIHTVQNTIIRMIIQIAQFEWSFKFAYTRSKIPSFEWSFKLRNLNDHLNLHTHGPKYHHSNDHSNCAIRMIVQIVQCKWSFKLCNSNDHSNCAIRMIVQIVQFKWSFKLCNVEWSFKLLHFFSREWNHSDYCCSIVSIKPQLKQGLRTFSLVWKHSETIAEYFEYMYSLRIKGLWVRVCGLNSAKNKSKRKDQLYISLLWFLSWRSFSVKYTVLNIISRHCTVSQCRPYVMSQYKQDKYIKEYLVSGDLVLLVNALTPLSSENLENQK